MIFQLGNGDIIQWQEKQMRKRFMLMGNVMMSGID